MIFWATQSNDVVETVRMICLHITSEVCFIIGLLESMCEWVAGGELAIGIIIWYDVSIFCVYVLLIPSIER